MTDHDQAAIEALLRVYQNMPRNAQGLFPVSNLASAILDAISAGKVPGVCASPDIAIATAYQCAEDAFAVERDQLRAEVERLRASLGDGPDAQAKEITRMRVEVKILKGLLEASREAGRKTQMEADGLRAEVERLKEDKEHQNTDIYCKGRKDAESEAQARADAMKADGERAVMEERDRTAKATAERDRLAGLLKELRDSVGKVMMPRADCECSDCLFLRSIDAALAEVGN